MSITLNEFIKKYTGKFVEVAGSPNAMYQCTDLANLYLKEVLKLPIIEWTNAVDFPSKVNPKDFEYILNTPEGVPEAGDLVVWGGKIGHIAIFVKGDVNWFTSMDQNWPTGSVCHLVDHSYSNVIGWLRPEGGNMSLQKEYDDCRTDRDAHWTNLQTMIKANKELEKDFEETNKKIDTLIIGSGLLENKYDTDLKKAKLDYEKLLADEKVAFKTELERVEEQHRIDLKELKEKYKGVDLPKPEPKPKGFWEKMGKAWEILFS